MTTTFDRSTWRRFDSNHVAPFDRTAFEVISSFGQKEDNCPNMTSASSMAVAVDPLIGHVSSLRLMMMMKQPC